MAENEGVFQLKNGNWGYRYVLYEDGKRKDRKKTTDESGNKLLTRKSAIRARTIALEREKNLIMSDAPLHQKKKKTVREVYEEYCFSGRKGKAYATIKKQDSLWRNHIEPLYGDRIISSITVAEVNDYLSMLYYDENRAFGYVEAFLKMFYLIFGQAYIRDYISTEAYSKLCRNKDTKIKMPKRKNDDEDEVIAFTNEEIKKLDEYFKGTNAETAYMLGKHCGLRIAETYGLMWDDINFESKTITIRRQMYYVDGVVRLMPTKTRNANRNIFMSDDLFEYLQVLATKNFQNNMKYKEIREQKSTKVFDEKRKEYSSLCLINTLPNGKMQTINSMKYHSRQLKEELGIVFKYHYLRHTYGTVLAELNTPTHILCNQMGHATSNVTEKYYLGISQRGVEILLENLNRKQ